MSVQPAPVPAMPDGELVTAHLAGRPDAFELLYRRYQPRLARWLAHRIDDRDAAPDLAHDVLVRALEALDGFDPDRPLWPWLKTIAANLAADYQRAAARRTTADHDTATDDTRLAVTDPTEILPERDLLTQALHTLPDRQRVALSLRYLHDWAPADIGKLLNLTRTGTEQLLLRARRRLCAEYRTLTNDKLRAWTWPLLHPLYRLRDRLTRIRDALVASAPGPTLATAEALTATAAVVVITAVLSVGASSVPAAASLVGDRDVLQVASHGIGSRSVTRSPGRTLPARQAPSLARSDSQGAFTNTNQEIRSVTLAAPVSPEPGQRSPRTKARAYTEENGGQMSIIHTVEGTDPITGEDREYLRGETEIGCGSDVRRAVCDGVQQVIHP